MIKHLLLAIVMISMVVVGFQVTSAAAATKGEELERRQNQRTDEWAGKQKQKAREDAESKADSTGVGREKKLQDKERQIDKQAVQRKKDDAEARSRLPKEKMNEPYTEKKTDTKKTKKSNR